MSGVMSEKQLTINKQITLCSKGKAENNSLKHRVGRREKNADLISILFCRFRTEPYGARNCFVSEFERSVIPPP